MKALRTLVSVVPYPLFPSTSAGRIQIVRFYNNLSCRVNTVVTNVRYGSPKPKVSFRLVEAFSPTINRYFNPQTFFRIKREIKHSGAEFVLFEHPYMAWMGLFLNRKSGLRWGIRSHNIEYKRFQSFGKWWWPVMKHVELLLYRRADAVFFITEDDRKTALAQTTIRNAFVMPTGMALRSLPDDAAACRSYLREAHGIAPDENILLYNGALDYKPNREALDVILKEVNPRLEAAPGFRYKLLICGSGLDAGYDSLREYAAHNVIYCGFVDDISVYFKGADLYLNPLIGGGGIKTRLVEAIAYNTNAVSTRNGYIGFNGNTVEDKVTVVEDGDWASFAAAIPAMCAAPHTDTTQSFYDYYFWDNIVARFVSQVNTVIS